MAQAGNQDLTERFIQFYRNYYREEIGALAQRYPNEQRSLYVQYDDLYQFDRDLAEDFRTKPDQMREYAEEALRLYDLPADVSLGRAHVRIEDLPEEIDIRGIRVHDDHIGKLVSVRGIVRKATDVRPKVTEAAFECQRCGTMTYIPQSDGGFQEPHECQGCERQGPFRVNFDQSEFIDSQKLRIQESPEGLRGGETPQSLDVDIVDDITGKVSPGDHVTCVGVLHIEQVEDGNEKSAIFDLYMDGVSIAIEDEEFEDMDITEADKREIIELSNREDIYDAMVRSVAPAIYGYEEEKLAMILQLFSGVTKHLPDGSRIRGDLHMLLIGDPGTGKCVKGDTRVTLGDGRERRIRELVESNLDDPKPVDDGVWDDVDFEVPALQPDGTIGSSRATKVWKREAPDRMYRIETASGRTVEVTPSHPLFVQRGGQFKPVVADDLNAGEFVATPKRLDVESEDCLDVDFRRAETYNAVHLDLPRTWTPALARLVGYIVAEGYVEKRDDHSGFVSITNNDEAVLSDVRSILESLGLDTTTRESHEEKTAREIMCSASELVNFLKELDECVLKGSAEQRVPSDVMGASAAITEGFIKAFVEGEGHVSAKQREITVASASESLLVDLRSLLLQHDITSQIHERNDGSHRLRISGQEFDRYVTGIGFVTDRKQDAAEEHLETDLNTNVDVVPNVGPVLKQVRESLGLTQYDCGVPRNTYRHYEVGNRNPSVNALGDIVDAFELASAPIGGSRSAPVAQTDGGTAADSITGLRRLAEGDIRWDRIESIEEVGSEDEWVYDLEVDGTHNYVSNGIVSHNSQMISYIRHIAPRSVYTSGKGSSSAGLCVTGDTKIHTADGFVPIREIATEYHPNPVDENTAVEAAHELYTFDREAGEIDSLDSSHVWRMPEKPCRRIETAHGKGLEASTNTPVLVYAKNGTEWREISKVSAGDHIAVPKYETIDRSSPPVREFIEFTEEKVKPTDESTELLRTRLCEEFGTLRDAAAALDLSEDFMYDSLSNRHLPLDRLSRILDAIDVELREIDVERAMLRHGDGVAIPDRFDPDLLYLIGLVFGDGDVMVSRRGGNRGHVRISNGDEEILERAADILEEKFDKSVVIEYQEERVPCIRLHSATVARFFSNVGVESPKDDIALDPRLTTAEHADAFLQGLFDADGSVCGRDDGGSSVQFSTVCDELAEQVQLMLETYGVRSRTRKRDRRGTYERADGHEIESTSVQTHLAMYGKDLDSFADRIGFRSTSKATALDEIVGDATRRGETLPIGDALARADGGAKRYWQNLNRGDDPSRERTRAMLDDLDLGDVEATVEEVADADLVWDEVVSAEDTGEKEVFDLTVPDTHNFIGNGFVTHNTAAAVRDDFGDGQQWTLEAGALVLADKGIAAVDELDKMRCVTGDTLVHTNDGITQIGEIALDAAKNGTIESLDNGRTIRDVDLRVWTMTGDNRLVKRDVTAIHEYDAPTELCEVTLESGETVTTTENHPFFVLEDGEHAEKHASELTPDDWVYVPEAVPQSSTDGGTASLTRKAATELPLDDRSLAPAHGAVLGYLAGDGNVYYNREEGSYGIRFTNAEEELLSDFEQSCREAFDGNPVRHPSEQRDDGVETVRLHGKAYVDELLNAGSNLETYDGKRVPEGLTTASRETKAAFLRALADAEGTVDERSVKVFSSSYDLLLGAKMLLLEFGVQCQIQTRERDRGRDVYTLAITDDESLGTFRTQIGFTLDRKRRALADAAERTTGDRTILDVLPDSGTLFAEARESLRLYQSECGLNATTYCDFENGTANASLHRAEQVLSRFEQRRRRAREDLQTLKTPCSWTALEQIKDRYHVTQSELADGTRYTQSQISREWGTADPLRETVRERLIDIVRNVSTVTFEQLAALIRGDVKWRRVSNVSRVHASTADDQLPILRERLADVVGGDTERVVERCRTLLGRELTADSWDQLRSVLKAHGISFQQVADSFDVAGSTVSRWFNGEVDGEDFETVRDRCFELVEAKRANVRELVNAYEQRAARVEQPKVYDLTVEGTHNFLANGMVVHNSEDRSAMHQALEQQRISVNKAGINATLKARCSLLGAANPKYGRFDQYEPIGEQIDLEPALISRFDLIFTVTDTPDPEHDSRLAKHIIKTNYAGELNTQREELTSSEFTSEQVAEVTDEVAPEIDAELLRKYIAHSKRSCYPTMTEEAKDLIENFYVDLRSKGADEDAPVPVTARKLEAMVRLAEASARVRLSDTVERVDADRATDIVESCLKDIGVDPETGQFDADVVETGTSKTQRDRIKNIKALIADIEEEYEEGAPIDEVLDRAGEIGMDSGKAEEEIEKLRTKGEVYEPKQGHLRTT